MHPPFYKKSPLKSGLFYFGTMKIKTELTRFKVRPEKIERAREWMNLLRDNLPLVLDTLESEKMFLETIFSEFKDGDFFLYWYSIQGDGGATVAKSHHEIDKKHLEFWKECIETSIPGEDLKVEVEMIPEKFREIMI